ncbi:MAG: hypothetical protein D6771_05570, partial [Zetaproteobacteria bacterium]
MPYLRLETNVEIEDPEGLAARLSAFAAEALGKSEAFVMVRIEPIAVMRFAGGDAPCAFLELRSLGLSEEAARALSERFTRFLADALNVPADRIYIAFVSPPRAMWGWNGRT